MLKNRLIPMVLLRDGVVVQSKRFKRYQRLGNPVTIVERLTDWAADELIYLDIGNQAKYDLGRDDLNAANRGTLLEILGDISKACFMPLTFGGGIRTIDDVAERLAVGADKVAINTAAIEDPAFITRCAKEFGSQCVVVSIDAKSSGDGYEVYGGRGKVPSGKTPDRWAAEAESRGAGEILINSIDRDGRGDGYDLDLVGGVVDAVGVPVIAAGGVGRWEHFAEALDSTRVSGLAAANIFHYTENSVYAAKAFLHDGGYPVRQPSLGVTD